MKIGVLTISDRGSRGEYEDRSGPLIVSILGARTPWSVTHQAIIPDEIDTIANTLITWTDEGVNLILTSGGTGFAPRDITPE
ncbi:MAG: molybdopterin-binding protein, partial [Anaerolineae bacterium]